MLGQKIYNDFEGLNIVALEFKQFHTYMQFKVFLLKNKLQISDKISLIVEGGYSKQIKQKTNRLQENVISQNILLKTIICIEQVIHFESDLKQRENCNCFLI